MGNGYAHLKEWGKCNVKTSGNLMSIFFGGGRKATEEAGEMTQRLNTFTALAQDSGSLLGAHSCL